MALVVDRIDHVVLNCRDVGTTTEWYMRVLGSLVELRARTTALARRLPADISSARRQKKRAAHAWNISTPPPC